MAVINIIHGDSLEAMKAMPDKAYELCICDPPYFDGPDKLGYYGGDVSQTKVKRQAYKILSKWEVPGEEYFSELRRVSKNQIVWGINYYLIQNLGVGRIVWDKINDFSTFSDGEIAYCSMIETVRFFRFMWNGMLQGDMKNKETRIHPTQKPVRLYEWLLKNYANPGDKILDTHGGSCSLAIACDIMGYDADIYEIDADYFQAATERFIRHKNQGVLEL